MKITEKYVRESLVYANAILTVSSPNTYVKKNISEISIGNAWSYWGKCTKIDSKNYRIYISKALFESIKDEESAKTRFMSTLVHELIHTQDGCMNHKDKFKRFAKAVNDKYPELNIQRCTSSAGLIEEGVKKTTSYKYEVTCRKCGAKFFYKRKTYWMEDVRHGSEECSCPHCNGHKFTVKDI